MRDSAHVHADRRQDTAHPKSADQPLLARHVICHVHRSHNFAHSLGIAHLRNRLRFYSSSTGTSGQRWTCRRFPLEPQPVATFYRRLMDEMHRLDLHVDIHTLPNEVADPIRFDRDEVHGAYDREYATRFWRILVQADRVFKEFRGRFIGKCSPVHLFWGALDLAVTRFSGRTAPRHPGGIPHLPDAVTREAYSHEVCSCGFWPGGGAIPYPAFYSYAYPEPAGFSAASIRPAAAFYSTDFGEFVLPYDAVRQSSRRIKCCWNFASRLMKPRPA